MYIRTYDKGLMDITNCYLYIFRFHGDKCAVLVRNLTNANEDSEDPAVYYGTEKQCIAYLDIVSESLLTFDKLLMQRRS